MTTQDPKVMVTAIVVPEVGWPVAYHCAICQKTVFLLSPWVVKPTNGDYHLIQLCADDDTHNLRSSICLPTNFAAACQRGFGTSYPGS